MNIGGRRFFHGDGLARRMCGPVIAGGEVRTDSLPPNEASCQW